MTAPRPEKHSRAARDGGRPGPPGAGREASALSPLPASIEAGAASPPVWRTIAKRTAVVVVAGVTLYLVYPSLTGVFASWPQLSSLEPIWLSVAVIAQIAHFTCTISLQRIALRTKAWFSVTTAQLTGNAISLIVPGGNAVGAVTQFRMLAAAGHDTSTAVVGLTAFSLLGIGGLLALPIFALPAIIIGAPVDRGLVHAALLGVVAFLLFAGFGALIMTTDRPLRLAGRVVQRVRNRVKRQGPPVVGLDDVLIAERDQILRVLGQRWRGALLLLSGRLAFDFLTLLATIRATGDRPNPSLVLLAYAVARILALIPLTPGGLGIVEGGLSAMLILAGIPAGEAVLSTLGYRIISYWLPIMVGPFAYLAFRIRYGSPAPLPKEH
jgi:uncharacterized protein (TIRG00374 family)